ncbi:MAG TPA: hypothetical protein VKA85_01370 [Candidatus Limnocylindrales bacterium]|nr:hypothetical protein [Candidatus Limnocylindrales bacterium]
MVELRWLRRLGPPFAALGAVALIASVVTGANPATPRGCAATATGSEVGTSAATVRAPEAVADGSWFRIDPRLDGTGTLRGQRVSIGQGLRAVDTVDLAAESFATGPFGNVVLVGSDDGTSSTLRARVGDCFRDVASERDVIRSAVLSADGATIYEHHVDRATRGDLGVWTRSASGGPAALALASIEADERYGRTFSTELAWAPDGTLVIQACGIASCRTRLFDPATHVVRTLADPDQGVLIGAAPGRIVTFASCRGLPCAVVSTDIETGIRTPIADATGPARVVDTSGGAVIVVETIARGSPALRTIDARTGEARDVALPTGLRLVGPTALAGGGIALPRSWVLLTPDGRPGGPGRSLFLNVVDGTTLALPEVRR